MKSGNGCFLKATLNHVKLSGHNPRALYWFSKLSTNSSLWVSKSFLLETFSSMAKKPNYFTFFLYMLALEYLPNIPAHFWSNL
jgi:hypothetical protein